ncbi:MAG: hypothetical protein Q7U04_16345 [Bacteriovorax sp.]|nr:hypothetical protein [Bacteriovorax sp.]
MKKLLLSLGLGLSFAASAAPVFVYPTCNYGSYSGECTIYNTSGHTITCNLQMRAQVKSGASINTSEFMTLYQGMFGSSRVYVNNPSVDPLVYLTANAYCNTVD